MLITAREACQRLKVKPATLYAYVSRGLIRSAETPGSRERRYDANDIERLERRRGRVRSRPPGLLPLDAAPMPIESALTLIEGGRLFYRGQDAIQLARHAAL